MKNKRLILLSIAVGVMAFCFLLFLRLGAANDNSMDIFLFLEELDILLLVSVSIVIALCVFIFSFKRDDAIEMAVKEPSQPYISTKAQRYISRLILIAFLITSVVYGGYTYSRTKSAIAYKNLDEVVKQEDIVDNMELIRMEGIPPIHIIGNVSAVNQKYIIEKCIVNQPAVLLATTELINICSHHEFEKLKASLDIEEAVAFATSYDNYIYIDCTAYEMKRVITHELSHNYDFQQGYLSQQKQFTKFYNETKDSEQFASLYVILNVEYAKSSASEYFAELSDAYFNEGKALNVLYPEAYTYMQTVYKE